MNRAIRFKCDADIEDEPFLRTDHKTTLSGRGLGHVSQFEIVRPLLQLSIEFNVALDTVEVISETTVKTANVNYMYNQQQQTKGKTKKSLQRCVRSVIHKSDN